MLRRTQSLRSSSLMPILPQVWQETALKAERTSTASADTVRQHSPAPSDLQTQLLLQHALQTRMAAKGQPGRPIPKTRGGNLIVMPDPVAKPPPAPTPGTSSPHLDLEPSKIQSPAGGYPSNLWQSSFSRHCILTWISPSLSC